MHQGCRYKFSLGGFKVGTMSPQKENFENKLPNIILCTVRVILII